MARTSRHVKSADLDALWAEFVSADGFTEDHLTDLFTQARHAHPSDAGGDRGRIALQTAILHQTWLIDGQTTWMAKSILTDRDATLRQKATAFITWFGLARPQWRTTG